MDSSQCASSQHLTSGVNQRCHYIQDDSVTDGHEGERHQIFSVGGSGLPTLQVSLDGCLRDVILDTGATMDVIPDNLLPTSALIQSTTKTLYAYGGTPLNVVGECYLSVSYANNSHNSFLNKNRRMLWLYYYGDYIQCIYSNYYYCHSFTVYLIVLYACSWNMFDIYIDIYYVI